MDSIDLFAMRESFNRQGTMLCFNGPISRSLIEEIGNALKNYLQAQQAQPSAAMDVFGTYIEMTQNIRHYASGHQYNERDVSATVVVAQHENGHYAVSAGNVLESSDGQKLLEKIEALAKLDKNELKLLYKEQLRKPRDAKTSSGAGLGLIDIARKSSEPLAASLRELPDDRAFFSLRAII